MDRRRPISGLPSIADTSERKSVQYQKALSARGSISIMSTIPQSPAPAPASARRQSLDIVEEGTQDQEDQSGTTIGDRSNSRINGHGRSRKDDSRSDSSRRGRRQAWYIRWIKSWGSGMMNDIRHRLPYYGSDWTDAWNYRVVPATWVCWFPMNRSREVPMD